MSALVLAHQNSVERMVSLFNREAEKSGGGEGSDASSKIQTAMEEQLAVHAEVLAKGRERIVSAVAANGRLFEKLSAHRILLTLILGYIGGLFTLPIFQSLVSFSGPLLH